jgi:hypothetical protein
MNKALTQIPLPDLSRPSGGSESLQVLQMVEAGRLSPGQAVQVLAALKAGKRAKPATAPAIAAPSLAMPGWRRWWRAPLLGGALVTGMGTLLMIGAFEAGGAGFWFVAAGTVFLGGVGLAGLALAARSVRWLHVRVWDGAGRWPVRIAFALPLPLRTAGWALRALGRWVPQLAQQDWDDMILEVARNTSADNPLSVEVDEGPGGARVQVLIG